MDNIKAINSSKININPTENIEVKKNIPKKEEINISDLVNQLNSFLDPFNTSIKFGFDNKAEVFFVSVIETKTEEVLRRFPIEDARNLLPKMKVLVGILFDQKV